MKILVIAIGSRGDVNPFLVLALKLMSLGHEVVFCASENYRKMIEDLGLRFIPHSTLQDYEAVTQDPDLWHYRKAMPTYIKKGLLPLVRRIYPLIMQERTKDFLVVAPLFALAAKLAEEVAGIKLVQLHLAPSMFRSLQDTAQIGAVSMSHQWPAWYKKLVWWIADSFFIDPCIKKELNSFRHELNLKPVSRILHTWMFSSCLNAAVFSRSIGPQQPDWPMPSEVFDFFLYDGNEQVSPEAQDFLSRGAPPIVFTFGTAFQFGKSDFEESVKALKMLGERGIFLTSKKEDIPDGLPDTIKAFSFLPLGRILPSCRAIVHHGGIGTLGQALKAGIPQLIRPMAYDQFDNAYRITTRKLGDYILARQYKAGRLHQKLRAILDDKEIAANCREVSGHIDSERALEALIRRIEELGAGGEQASPTSADRKQRAVA
jgi:UDP:flavonoid glycosyltransferase YjiC (YdhE family)